MTDGAPLDWLLGPSEASWAAIIARSVDGPAARALKVTVLPTWVPAAGAVAAMAAFAAPAFRIAHANAQTTLNSATAVDTATTFDDLKVNANNVLSTTEQVAVVAASRAVVYHYAPSGKLALHVLTRASQPILGNNATAALTAALAKLPKVPKQHRRPHTTAVAAWKRKIAAARAGSVI